jgi:phosphomannomutase
MGLIRFGTDGWRAVIADQFTFSAVDRVSQAVSCHFRSHPPPDTQPEWVVGYDTRFGSAAFAVSIAEVFAGNGFRVLLAAKPCPTPCLSFAVKARGAMGGVMVTASHNPGIFNGFKLKSHFGGAASIHDLRGVECCLDREAVRKLALDEGLKRGHIRRLNLEQKHFQAVRQLVDWPLLRRARLRILHDALHGVGAGCFARLLTGSACRVTGLHESPDPMFGGRSPEPIPSNYSEASAFLRRQAHDLCLVTDGDADRLGGLDGHGRPLTTHQIICLLLDHLVANRGQRGRVIKALNTTSMVDRICAAYGLPLTETGVGFKYICAEMVKGDALAGVEESGGVALRGHLPERDGLAAGLLLLELLECRKQSIDRLLRDLERRFGQHHYGRLDLHEPRNRVERCLERLGTAPLLRLGRSPVERVQTFDGIKLTARNGDWLMLRGSGTEPLVRIYAEASSRSGVERLLRLGHRLLRRG